MPVAMRFDGSTLVTAMTLFRSTASVQAPAAYRNSKAAALSKTVA